MFSGPPPSKNASSRRTAAHRAELIRMKNADVAPALVSARSWDVVCSFPRQLANALLPAVVLIVQTKGFPSLSLCHTLAFSAILWLLVTARIATADFLSHR